MADFYGSSRTNYFRVKDRAAFEEVLQPLLDEEAVEIHDGDDGRLCVLAVGHFGTFPTSYYDDKLDEDIEFEFPELIAPHLADGEVAVVIEVGAEKLRYVLGSATAINNKGETRRVSLDLIYELAADLGSEITRAEY